MKKMLIGVAAAVTLAGCSTCECEKCASKSKYVVVEDTAGQRAWNMPFKLGLAGYTMQKNSLDETLEIMKA
ncbi:MAG: hypothetical protein KBT68_01315, partial [bacterium]|nr:hypothetical protein [Candidatus Colisoma equi]